MSALLPTFSGIVANFKKYELSDFAASTSSHLSDGTKMQLNDDGRITQIQYASGAAVRRHANFVLMRSSNSSYWFGDSAGRWYPID